MPQNVSLFRSLTVKILAHENPNMADVFGHGTKVACNENANGSNIRSVLYIGMWSVFPVARYRIFLNKLFDQIPREGQLKNITFFKTKTIGKLSVLMLGGLLSTAAIADQDAYEECLLREIQNATSSTQVNDLKAACSPIKLNTPPEQVDTIEPISAELLTDEQDNQTIAAVDKRLKRESQTELRPWVLTPHKPNYFLPASYNASPPDELYQSVPDGGGDQLDNVEIKFQLSLKVPVAMGLFNDRANIFAAYTNTSWWQAYNSDASSPFRETNHEPELFINFENHSNLLGFTNRLNTLGIVHQSNGRSEPLSRSWNRVYASMLFEKGGVAIQPKLWYRLEEDEANDNNPDITDYLGYGSLGLAYSNRKNTFSALGRKKSVELTWSRYVWGNTRLYAQYFNGYGQSLIEYDKKSEVFGLGVAISDWL